MMLRSRSKAYSAFFSKAASMMQRDGDGREWSALFTSERTRDGRWCLAGSQGRILFCGEVLVDRSVICGSRG